MEENLSVRRVFNTEISGVDMKTIIILWYIYIKLKEYRRVTSEEYSYISFGLQTLNKLTHIEHGLSKCLDAINKRMEITFCRGRGLTYKKIRPVFKPQARHLSRFLA